MFAIKLKFLPLLTVLLITVVANSDTLDMKYAVIAGPTTVNLSRSTAIPISIRVLPCVNVDSVTLSTSAGYFSAPDESLCKLTLKPGGVANTLLHFDNIVGTTIDTVQLTLKSGERLLASNDVKILHPNAILIQSYSKDLPADGSTRGKLLASVLDQHGSPLAGTPILMTADIPGQDAQVLTQMTDSDGHVSFDLPASAGAGDGDFQLQIGKVLSPHVNVRYFTSNIQFAKVRAVIVASAEISESTETGIPITVILTKLKDAEIPASVTLVTSSGTFGDSANASIDLPLKDGLGMTTLNITPLLNAPVTLRVLLKQKITDDAMLTDCIGMNVIQVRSHIDMSVNVIPLGKDDPRQIAGLFDVTVVDADKKPVFGVPVTLLYGILDVGQQISMQVTDENGHAQFPIPLSKVEGLCTYQALTEYYAPVGNIIKFKGDGRIIGWGNRILDNGSIDFLKKYNYDENGRLVQ